MGANDSLDWASLGKVVGTSAFSPVSHATVNNITMSAAVGTPGVSSFAVNQQCPGTGGTCSPANFPANTFFLNNQFIGPVTFSFSTPVQGFGLTLDSAFAAPYTATIAAYNGATLCRASPPGRRQGRCSSAYSITRQRILPR